MGEVRELSYIIKRDKSVYSKLKHYMEVDLQSTQELLNVQRNPDEKTYLQGKISKLTEYIKLLT